MHMYRAYRVSTEVEWRVHHVIIILTLEHDKLNYGPCMVSVVFTVII